VWEGVEEDLEVGEGEEPRSRDLEGDREDLGEVGRDGDAGEEGGLDTLGGLECLR